MTRARIPTRPRMAALAIGAVALLAAGCGGDDEEAADTTVGMPLSKADFIAQADAICADGEAAINQAAAEEFGTAQPSPEEGAAFVDDVVIPTLEDEANQIDELGPPNGDVEDVEEIVAGLRGAIEEVEDNPEGVLDGSAESAFADVNELAGDYGLKECGSG
jgi:hypothetical protein